MLKQVIYVFTFDVKNKSASVFIKQGAVKGSNVHWERFSNHNCLRNTLAFELRALKKMKWATAMVAFEEIESAKTSIFKLLQLEEVRRVVKISESWSINPEKQLDFTFSVLHCKNGSYSLSHNRKVSTGYHCKASIIFTLESSSCFNFVGIVS